MLEVAQKFIDWVEYITDNECRCPIKYTNRVMDFDNNVVDLWFQHDPTDPDEFIVVNIDYNTNHYHIQMNMKKKLQNVYLRIERSAINTISDSESHALSVIKSFLVGLHNNVY